MYSTQSSAIDNTKAAGNLDCHLLHTYFGPVLEPSKLQSRDFPKLMQVVNSIMKSGLC